MADARTPGKWPYRAAKPGRGEARREDAAKTAPRGVLRREEPAPRSRGSRRRRRGWSLLAALVSMIVGGRVVGVPLAVPDGAAT